MPDKMFQKELQAHTTPINGLIYYDLTVHGDSRGWFKENWQREKMTSIGLADFGPVQNNISFNEKKGVTRGLHAEPWDKYISVASGKVFGAWCDLREGSETYGEVFTLEIDPSISIYVPRGVANGFQALEDNTAYTYLVNDHWYPDAEYSFVNLADPKLAIKWPINLDEAELSDKDKNHPHLANTRPVPAKKILITGANGQLGRAFRDTYPNAEFVCRDELDISSENLDNARRWKNYGVIINTAAYTQVDLAETKEGREKSWQSNAKAVANLARIASAHNITLVHISSDYVFDGTKEGYTEDDTFSPLSVYGQSKAAGDIATTTVPRHYIARTSWVIGEGKNFVTTMQSLAENGVKPSVVNDQVGRPTFTKDLAEGIKHLLDSQAPFGTYNITNDGEPASWAEVAKEVYKLTGESEGAVTPVSTKEYYSSIAERNKQKATEEGVDFTDPVIAPRPLQSTLNIVKLKQLGYSPRDWKVALSDYINKDNN